MTTVRTEVVMSVAIIATSVLGGAGEQLGLCRVGGLAERLRPGGVRVDRLLLGQEVALHEDDHDLGDHGDGETDAEHRAPVGAHGGDRAVEDLADPQRAERDDSRLRRRGRAAPPGSRGHAGPARSGRGCAGTVAGGARAGTTAPEAAGSGDHCPAGPRFRRRAAEGFGMPVSWPSEGADPGEAQPGESFIVAPSQSRPLIGAAGCQPSCHASVRCGSGARISFLPSCAGGSAGRLGRWLIRTRNRRWASSLRPSPYSAGTSPRKGPPWCLSTRRGFPPRRSSSCAPMCPRWCEAIRTLAVRGAPLLGIAGGYGVALAAARGEDVESAAELLEQARPTAVNLGYGARRVARAYQAAVGSGPGPEAAAVAPWPRRGLCTGRTRRPVGGWRSTVWSCSGELLPGEAGTGC